MKENVYANIQMIGAAAHQFSKASDNIDDLNFNTDILAGFRNAKFNNVAEMDHQIVWNIIESELDVIHEEAMRASAVLGSPESEW